MYRHTSGADEGKKGMRCCAVLCGLSSTRSSMSLGSSSPRKHAHLSLSLSSCLSGLSSLVEPVTDTDSRKQWSDRRGSPDFVRRPSSALHNTHTPFHASKTALLFRTASHWSTTRPTMAPRRLKSKCMSGVFHEPSSGQCQHLEASSSSRGW